MGGYFGLLPESLRLTGSLIRARSFRRPEGIHSFAEICQAVYIDIAAGTIINPKTARSQILGAMVWSISKALREETILDENFGRYMNSNPGEYHIPVHADIHDLDVIFADEKDELINELGVKGVGEIGMVAMPAAAIANAIFHATGKRVNKLPIHFDELM